jgi:guanylate kinase
MKNKGNLFVISGPSGVGKGTVCRALIEKCKSVSISVSATTRKPRTEDTEGVTYFFKTQDEFRKMIDDGKFLEWAVYNGNYYGTPVEAVEKKLDEGFDVILEIEVQGALKVMDKRPNAVSIFIAPPDTEVLYQRLKGRGTEDEEEIEKRVKAAQWELEQKNKYNYIVVNDKLNDAVAAIENIMKNEREKM